MSLINKMLQDLDARGGDKDAALEAPALKAVPAYERDRRPLLLAGAGVAAAVVLAAGGWYGWQYWKGHSAPPGPVPKVLDNRVPDQPRFQQPPAAVLTEQAPAVALSEQAPAAVKPDAVAPIAKPKRPAPVALDAEDHEPAVAAPARARKPAPVAAAPAASADAVVSDLTPKQVADNTYRRALASLQEGRVSSALADLDKALEIDPRNDAARQTYVSLLLESKRTDDAIRQLRLALGIEPRQPGLAMVLARLQLEKGGPALETLMNTLPYAQNSADYQGFLAGVLQREQRHAEAAQYYREALKISPSNGIWWMGLGISLQAEQHLPEAREAYTRARAANGLTPELQAFIERKLELLGR
jgi:MSHA biogenesis protein MshN